MATVDASGMVLHVRVAHAAPRRIPVRGGGCGVLCGGAVTLTIISAWVLTLSVHYKLGNAKASMRRTGSDVAPALFVCL